MQKRFRLCGLVLMLPVLAFLVVSSGCSGDKKGGDGGPKAGDSGKPAKPPVKAGAKTELDTKGWGSLTGKVVYDGDPPTPADYKETREDFKTHPDHKVCEEGYTKDPTWMVGADKGVQNVVVWIAPPAGKYFKLPMEKSWEPEVKVDQPHCAFEPHVTVLFPGRYNYATKKFEKDQTFKILNSAPMKHNTKWGGSPGMNSGGSLTLEAGDKAGHVFDIQPDREPVALNCDIHKWMTGYVWAFDHPYAAVTKPDGTFEIKNVPTGAEVDVYYWHESMGKAPKLLKKATLMDGENKLDDIKVSK